MLRRSFSRATRPLAGARCRQLATLSIKNPYTGQEIASLPKDDAESIQKLARTAKNEGFKALK